MRRADDAARSRARGRHDAGQGASLSRQFFADRADRAGRSHRSLRDRRAGARARPDQPAPPLRRAHRAAEDRDARGADRSCGLARGVGHAWTDRGATGGAGPACAHRDARRLGDGIAGNRDGPRLRGVPAGEDDQRRARKRPRSSWCRLQSEAAGEGRKARRDARRCSSRSASTAWPARSAIPCPASTRSQPPSSIIPAMSRWSSPRWVRRARSMPAGTARSRMHCATAPPASRSGWDTG